MECNCSNENCEYHIPAACYVGKLKDELLVSVIGVRTKRPRIITFTTWTEWCENLRCDPKTGEKHQPYVFPSE